MVKKTVKKKAAKKKATVKSAGKHGQDAHATRGKRSALVDTRVVYCGDNLDQLRKLPDGCVDLVYIDPPFNSNRNYEVWGRHSRK